jgi:hypothetical protein
MRTLSIGSAPSSMEQLLLPEGTPGALSEQCPTPPTPHVDPAQGAEGPAGFAPPTPASPSDDVRGRGQQAPPAVVCDLSAFAKAGEVPSTEHGTLRPGALSAVGAA